MEPVIGVTMGDPAGIGPEIVAKAVVRPDVRARARPLVIGNAAHLARTVTALGLRARVTTDGEPGPDRIVVHDVAVPALDGLRMGAVQAVAGRAAAAYVEAAVRLARDGRVAAVATAPLHKEALWAAGYPYPGHTEMLEALTGSPYSLTMFQVRGLRVFFLTRHLPLREAIAQITAERTLQTLERMQDALARLGLPRPRIAVAALNPHAGEGGRLGAEEGAHLEPAVLEAQRRGLDVVGPVPADAVFAQALEGRYDAVLALYHDQGHIAAKTLDFHGTVSVTLGLPFIRTSVDHGTAFDIAGKGVAREDSMAAAIVTAAQLARLGVGAR
ncbi:MAG: 4-hydroxythreonine-4-phosphate dehydrogenase PdxA [Firmicutes bacterium]|nr:4-hydroxythreonine-4-phosphate dehydrogenase PdxA [Bacillota bacterium]